MKPTSDAAFETAIETVLLNDGYGKLASIAFDAERAIELGNRSGSAS
ncbi:MAG: hypothetical protein ACLFRG_05160 [Desulfococcaceae bacterium]